MISKGGSEMNSLKYLVKFNKLFSEDNIFIPRDVYFEKVEADTVQGAVESVGKKYASDSVQIDYVVQAHPVIEKLIRDFGANVVDGAIRYSMGMGVTPEPAILTHIVLQGANLLHQGSVPVSEEVREYLDNTEKQALEQPEQAVLGSLPQSVVIH
jgi:hypothetical protein